MEFRDYREVCEYMEYEDGPDVPVVMPSQVGGIYRIGPGVIQVTFISQFINNERHVAKAISHQVWNQEAWFTCERLFHMTARNLEEKVPRKRLLRTVN